MPLPLSETELSEDEIEPKKIVKEDPIEEAEAEEDEDEDEESVEQEDEYVVQHIVSHAFEDGICKYEVKWKGWDGKNDNTWEPEDNLTSAQESLEAYFNKLGGRPQWDFDADDEVPLPGMEEKQLKKGKGNRKRSSTAVESPAAAKGRRGKKARGDDTPEVQGAKKVSSTLPTGSWEQQINIVETIEEVPDEVNKGEMKRVAYVVWNDGRKTAHQLKVVNQKCPQKMLAYYEQHLVFKSNAPVKDDTAAPADEEMNGA